MMWCHNAYYTLERYSHMGNDRARLFIRHPCECGKFATITNANYKKEIWRGNIDENVEKLLAAIGVNLNGSS